MDRKSVLASALILFAVLNCSFSVPLRLVGGGGSKYQGNVQVFHENQWKAICDDHWDLRDAKVVCRQLGFAKAINFTTK